MGGIDKSLADKINRTKHKGAKSASRADVTWCDPDDVVIITNPDDKHYADYYDERVEWPLNEDKIIDLEMNGQITPVKVLVNGDDVVVIAGKRRTLHIREVNRRRAKGLIYDPEQEAWIKGSGPRDKMQLRIEQIPRGLTVGEIQRLILGENTSEPETKRTLAMKIQRFSKHSSPAQLRASLNGMSKLTFDGLMLYTDLSEEAKRAVDEGRLKIANIPDIAGHKKADQPAAIAALPPEVTHVDEIRTALDDYKNGKTPTAESAKERKKTWSKRELTAFRDTLVEAVPEKNKERQIAESLINLFLGDTRGFKRNGPPTLISVLEAVDKDGEKRRKKARVRAAKEKKAKEGAEA